MFDMMKIAKMIKRARIRKNMTQMDLADEMGVSYQAVSNWERVQSEKARKRLNLSAIVGMAVSGSGNTS